MYLKSCPEGGFIRTSVHVCARRAHIERKSRPRRAPSRCVPKVGIEAAKFVRRAHKTVVAKRLWGGCGETVVGGWVWRGHGSVGGSCETRRLFLALRRSARHAGADPLGREFISAMMAGVSIQSEWPSPLDLTLMKCSLADRLCRNEFFQCLILKIDAM